MSARFEGGAIALAVPAAVVDESTFPAVLDPIISAEVDLGTTTIPDGAEDIRWSPSMGAIGASFLLAWVDGRPPTV